MPRKTTNRPGATRPIDADADAGAAALAAADAEAGAAAEAGNRVREKLQAAGLRATRPRTLVYAVLREAGGHRSVDEVVELLERRGHAIPRMSVYNVMADLTAAALVMPADTGPGRALYEASDVWHHHFVCRGCGKIEDVPCLKGRKPCLLPSKSLPGSTIDEAQVIFRGHCADCAAKHRGGKARSIRTNSKQPAEHDRREHG